MSNVTGFTWFMSMRPQHSSQRVGSVRELETTPFKMQSDIIGFKRTVINRLCLIQLNSNHYYLLNKNRTVHKSASYTMFNSHLIPRSGSDSLDTLSIACTLVSVRDPVWTGRALAFSHFLPSAPLWWPSTQRFLHSSQVLTASQDPSPSHAHSKGERACCSWAIHHSP